MSFEYSNILSLLHSQRNNVVPLFVYDSSHSIEYSNLSHHSNIRIAKILICSNIRSKLFSNTSVNTCTRINDNKCCCNSTLRPCPATLNSCKAKAWHPHIFEKILAAFVIFGDNFVKFRCILALRLREQKLLNAHLYLSFSGCLLIVDVILPTNCPHRDDLLLWNVRCGRRFPIRFHCCFVHL